MTSGCSCSMTDFMVVVRAFRAGAKQATELPLGASMKRLCVL
jgi:hypothetical protein